MLQRAAGHTDLVSLAGERDARATERRLLDNVRRHYEAHVAHRLLSSAAQRRGARRRATGRSAAPATGSLAPVGIPIEMRGASSLAVVPWGAVHVARRTDAGDFTREDVDARRRDRPVGLIVQGRTGARAIQRLAARRARVRQAVPSG